MKTGIEGGLDGIHVGTQFRCIVPEFQTERELTESQFGRKKEDGKKDNGFFHGNWVYG
jgi:hypothetical protein